MTTHIPTKPLSEKTLWIIGITFVTAIYAAGPKLPELFTLAAWLLPPATVLALHFIPRISLDWVPAIISGLVVAAIEIVLVTSGAFAAVLNIVEVIGRASRCLTTPALIAIIAIAGYRFQKWWKNNN